MDKGGKGKKAARSRASSLSTGSSSNNKASKGKTPRTASLEGEATRVAAMAAAADAKAKAHQRKMTEFIQGQEQGQGRTAQGGAGELVSGPSGPSAATGEALAQGQGQGQVQATLQDGAGELVSGPSGTAVAGAQQGQQGQQENPDKAAAQKQVQFQVQVEVHTDQGATQRGAGELGAGPSNPGTPSLRQGDSRSLADQAEAIQRQLRQYRDQAAQGQDEIAVVDVIPPRGQQQQVEEGGWQQYVSRKNRKIGGQLEYQQQTREATPFKTPGQHYSSRGYYSSTNERNRARMDHARSNRSSVVAALTPRQWEWYKHRVCLACGEDHQVKECRKVTKERGFALDRATRNCPPDMRPLPQNRDGRGPQSEGNPRHCSSHRVSNRDVFCVDSSQDNGF